MSTGTKFARAFSLRDKKGRPRSRLFDTFTSDSHRDSISEATDHYGLFTLDDNAKKISKDEDKKISEIKETLSRLGSKGIADSRIAYALRAPGIDGDVTKAMELLILFQDSMSGVIKPFHPQVKMLGAENREKVTCYLDASLFAMFSKTTVFEAMIYHDFSDEQRRKLVTILRLWINMLRTGRLITTDITRKLQESLSECGWPDAAKLRQQDASEAFGFITDKLDLPLLTLKTDLFHQGKYDKDDHKFITERLLDVAIPEDAPQDTPIPLEKCLEEYFNNKVEIKRELQRRNTLTQQVKAEAAKSSGEKDNVTHIETSEVEPRAESPRPTEAPTWNPPPPPRPLQLRDRAASIFSERRVEILDGVSANKDQKEQQDSESRPAQLANMRKGSVRKEVAMPAWQFLNLIPWYTDNATETDTQVKAHFASRRPMLGICLKRYKVSNTGVATRLGTRVDIPLEMAPPHFAVEDRNEADESANPNLKLVLQAVVCHRGQHVNSGHYIAFVRTTDNDPHGSFSDMTSSGSDPDSGRNTWLKHDDLYVSNRVTAVDIREALKTESPYLLFYQVLPVDEASLADEPPPYQESSTSFSTLGEKLAGLQGLQGRPSTEIVDFNSRRPSVAVSDEARSNAINNGSISHRGSDQRPPSFVRQDSGGNASTGGISQRTRPTTPHDGLQHVMSEPKRSKTRSGRPSTDVGKRMGEFVSRIGGGGSREKVNIQETALPSQEDLSTGAPNNDIDQSNEKVLDKSSRKSLDQPASTPKGKNKEKDKKLKSKSKSRRSSVPLGKLPERECRVM